MLSLLIQNQPSVVDVSKLVLLVWPKTDSSKSVVLGCLPFIIVSYLTHMPVIDHHDDMIV
jgi:hypothetical protein